MSFDRLFILNILASKLADCIEKNALCSYSFEVSDSNLIQLEQICQDFSLLIGGVILARLHV